MYFYQNCLERPMLYFHLHVYFPVVVTWLVQSTIHSRSIQPNSSFSSIHSIQRIFRLPHSSISRPISTYIRTSHFGCELIVRIRTFCDVQTFGCGCGLGTTSSHAKCKMRNANVSGNGPSLSYQQKPFTPSLHATAISASPHLAFL